MEGKSLIKLAEPFIRMSEYNKKFEISEPTGICDIIDDFVYGQHNVWQRTLREDNRDTFNKKGEILKRIQKEEIWIKKENNN